MSVKPSRTIPGQLSDSDVDAIITLAKRVGEYGVVVEIGSLYGLSSWIWSKNTPSSAKIFCVDPWIHAPWIDKVRDKFGAADLSVEAFRSYVSDCTNIHPIQGYSPDCCAGWSDPLDIYFDDADHRNPVLARNISFWSQFVKPGGIASGHDYNKSHPDVVSEANALAHKWRAKLNISGNVWWVERPADLD